ncbi:cation-translocating P-type ATPase [Actinomadura sp. NBRC 104412]|uniref:cation-translocating P-type ATPase n=1 Tax=Actinomadura sp. NBRC 104412 TaxID=3032203 RepID=UPI0025522B24|nr:cation-translocating P-type ATPase [Actinomadura sp. NBRC 104412]
MGVLRSVAGLVPRTVSSAVSGAAGLAGSLPLPKPPLPKPSLLKPRLPDLAGMAERAELANLIGHRVRRRTWSRKGRAYIEIRGHPTARTRSARELRDSAAAAVRRLKGVHWAQVNAVTGEILCLFDEDRVDLDGIVDAIAAVEDAQQVGDEAFPMEGHPADTAPVTAEAIALASDCAAFALASAGRFVRLPRLPPAARIALAWMDSQPRLRRELETRLGHHGADLVLSVGGAVLHGLTQEPSGLALDALHRGVQVAELRARRAAWSRWETALCAPGLPADAPERAERPCPLPPGPVEKWADRSSIAALVGAAGVVAFGRDPRAASALLLAAVPRASRIGRSGFASTLGRELAGQGVVPLDGAAYRRLDRVTAVVVDSSALCGTEHEIVSADGPEVWDATARLLTIDPGIEGVRDRDGWCLHRVSAASTDPLLNGTGAPGGSGDSGDPRGLRVQVMDPTGHTIGEALIGRRLDPRAEAVLSAARDSGARILLTEHAATAELLPLVDEALDASVPLAEHVRALQRDGEGVLVVTTGDEDAALAADVGVSVSVTGLDESAPPICWSSDLVCTGGLEQVWRLMVAVGATRAASERAVRLAIGGSALGTLLVLTGDRSRSRLDLTPVHGAALIALVSGFLSARRLAARPVPVPVPRVPWHALDPQAAAERALRLRDEGARDRAPAHRLPEGIRSAPPVRAVAEVAGAVWHELRDPLTPVLVLGAAASAVVGSGVDAALVGGVMAGNALISGIQRSRAERALRGLLLGQRAPARRVRVQGGPRDWDLRLDNGVGWAPHDDIPAAELRPGDVIAVRASDVVPADARLLVAEDLEVDEATLTGESTPVPKSVAAAPGADLAERACMLYEETTVLTGRAYAVVVATGSSTQAGRAAALAGEGAAPTGVQARLNELTRVSLPVSGFSGALVSALGMLRGMSARQAISSGVAVAVAAVPEGLTLVATVAQLAAARRLSRRDVLVRSSRTLGTLGRADVVCFDKTGTLTDGRLKVTTISGPRRDLEPGGAAWRRVLATAARACPDPNGGAGPARHATDRAVLEAAAGLGDDTGWEALRTIPFEPSRGYSAALGRDDGVPYVAVKGAPEVLLPHCGRVVTGRGTEPMTEERRAQAEATVRRLAGRGLRVLAVGHTEPDALDADEEVLAGLALLGFVGIADPVRPDAAEAIGTLTAAGIRVTMITGDHPDTARAVAAELGVPNPERTMTGAELDRLSDRDRTRRIAETSVFARVTPEHKVRIVQALRRAGRVVAMTGDGANDAAAIRLADVGIGLTAGDSRAAPSAADLILRGGDLPGIVAALLEGRALWESVRNAVSILVGGNVGEVAFTLYGTTLGGGQAPLTTRQLLLVNMLTDMMPALAVALAPPGEERSDRAGRPSRPGVLGDPLHDAIVARGVVTALGAILAWQIGRFTGRGRRAGTMGLAALVITQLAQTLQTGWRSPAVLATCAASLLVLALVIETPGVSHFFGSVPLGPVAWSVVLGAAAAATVASVLGPRLVERLR